MDAREFNFEDECPPEKPTYKSPKNPKVPANPPKIVEVPRHVAQLSAEEQAYVDELY